MYSPGAGDFGVYPTAGGPDGKRDWVGSIGWIGKSCRQVNNIQLVLMPGGLKSPPRVMIEIIV